MRLEILFQVFGKSVTTRTLPMEEDFLDIHRSFYLPGFPHWEQETSTIRAAAQSAAG
jgi:hypothetical protein